MVNVDRFRRILFSLSIALTVTLTIGCATRDVTKSQAFPGMYREHPQSILVPPPINRTTASEARGYYLTTIQPPLANQGFYVYPVEVITDVMKAEGMYQSGNLMKIDPAKFKKHFGADAVLYVIIKEWDTTYLVVAANVTVSLQYILRSTETGNILWAYEDRIVRDTSGEGSNDGVAGLVVQAVETAVQTATTQYVQLAREVNRDVMVSLPNGPYHPAFLRDKKQRTISPENLPEPLREDLRQRFPQ